MRQDLRSERIRQQLDRLKLGETEALKQLLWTELGYTHAQAHISRRDWPETQSRLLAEDPLLFAVGGEGELFKIIVCRLSSDHLLLTDERTVVTRLLTKYQHALFIFSNRRQTHWHFLNVKQDADPKRRRLYRRITVGPEERLRTAAERLAMIAIDAAGPGGLFGPGFLELRQAHDEAFDVEQVTKKFFADYRTIFADLRDDLQEQTGDTPWSHDYALQFLNRLMFLYFVQRKRWLGDDAEFLHTFWKAYRRAGQPADSFVDRWLHVMFFEAFNNGFHGGHKQFPDDIHEALSTAPFLNGGLFKQNDDDRKHKGDFLITDQRFDTIKEFLDRYNFTITEDSPLDQEIAVDPEMIGKVYESLVNATEKETTEDKPQTADRRGESGIFYTPRTEIDLMCRLSLVDNLANHLGTYHRNLFYELVFALEPQEKADADQRLDRDMWQRVRQHLQEITVVDPACGSGSFLVGMLYLLNDLLQRAEAQLGDTVSGYERKKEIIGRSLYGVDVMKWACHVAELRLWLALIIEADFSPEQLHVRNEPLLPHFTFHIRCGDSLVEEVGGVNLAYVHTSALSPALKAKITHHRRQKACFYHNDPNCEYNTDQQAQDRELQLFREIMSEQEQRLTKQIADLQRKINGPQVGQMLIDGTVADKAHQMELKAQEWQLQVDTLAEERARIQAALQQLRTVRDVPFVWDIAFVEIFEGETNGFDIVIGNPPYVRQEKIADPNLSRDEITTQNKQEYKTKLARAVYESFDKYFDYNPSTGKTNRTLGKKNDLYIYFYFRGLRLLNPQGTFCFITSNSWLDVGYGADLQEFLLRQAQVKLVMDNQAKRSFADADVNTVIVLLSPPTEPPDAGLKNTARFVMFLVPFEHILPLEKRESGAAVVFEEIEEATGRKIMPEYRLNALPQARLLEEGLQAAEEEPEKPAPRRKQGSMPLPAKYTGNKWGGKYLRAPEIYWTILEKAGDRLVRLGDVAQVRRGFTTGCNEFFYLPSKHFGIERDGDFYRLIPKHEGLPDDLTIEAEYLPPAILRLAPITGPIPDDGQVSHRCLVLPDVSLRKLSPGVRQYIQWGYACGYGSSATCRSRSTWYSLREANPPQLMVPRRHKRRPFIILNNIGALASDGLVFIYPHDPAAATLIAASMFTTFDSLQREVLGQANFGQGVLETQKGDVPDFMILNPGLVTPAHATNMLDAFSALAQRPIRMIYDDICLGDRAVLDTALLESLGFDAQPALDSLVQAMQDETCRIIWHRMAKTDNSREARQTYYQWLSSGEPFGLDIADEAEE